MKKTSREKAHEGNTEASHLLHLYRSLYLYRQKDARSCMHWCQTCIHSTHQCSTQQCSRGRLKGPAKALITGTFPAQPAAAPRLDHLPLSAAQAVQWALQVTPKCSSEAAAAPALSAPQGHRALQQPHVWAQPLKRSSEAPLRAQFSKI